MKLPHITSKPGFELVFALSIAAIFIIPSMVMAQTQKSMEIIITNGDTVINGKNIKTLSPAEKAQAMTDMQKLKGTREKRRSVDVIITRPADGRPGQAPMIVNDGMAHQYGDYVGGDRIDRPMHLKRMNTDSTTVMTYQFRMDDGKQPPLPPTPPMAGMNDGRPRVQFFKRDDMGGPMRGNRVMRNGRRNSQRFSYSNTDGNGATTNINYSVTEPMDEDMADDKKQLTITDIKLVPDFTSGKTMLSFSLPTKAAAEVEFINSEDKILWSERGSVESFNRTFPLPLNGMYKLKVKQGGKTVTKNIMKEE